MNDAPPPTESARDEAYRKHAATKETVIRSSLADLGLESAFARFHSCPKLQGFRGRAHLSIEPGESGPRLCGIDPVSGPAPFEETRWVLPSFAQAITPLICDRILETGSFPSINGFDLRFAHGRQRLHLSLTAQKSMDCDRTRLAESLLEAIPALTGVVIPSQGREFGKTSIRHVILEHEIAQHHSAFFQTNLHLTPSLAAAVQDALGQDEIEELVDLYCGVGLHSILAVDRTRRFLGADNHRAAIASAKANAQGTRLSHADFHCVSADAFVRSHRPGPDATVILNPPRAGCSEKVIRAVASWNPARIINVSCCLETHLANFRLWQDLGWTARRIEAFDMFPFTRFVETVTLLEPR